MRLEAYPGRMNERPIRIVVAEQGTGPNTVYQIGSRLPQPLPNPEEPLVIVDIDEYVDDEDNPDVFIVLSVGEENSEYQQNGIGFMTRIPASLVVRRDSAVSAAELIEALAEKQVRLQAEEDEPEADEPQPAPSPAEPPPQQPMVAEQGVSNAQNGGQ